VIQQVSRLCAAGFEHKWVFKKNFDFLKVLQEQERRSDDTSTGSASSPGGRRCDDTRRTGSASVDGEKRFDPYEALCIEPGASMTEIKSAYRRLALRHHPDKNNGNLNSQRQFLIIQHAYERLDAELGMNRLIEDHSLVHDVGQANRCTPSPAQRASSVSNQSARGFGFARVGSRVIGSESGPLLQPHRCDSEPNLRARSSQAHPQGMGF